MPESVNSKIANPITPSNGAVSNLPKKSVIPVINTFTAKAEIFIKYYQIVAIALVLCLSVGLALGLYLMYSGNIDTLESEKARASETLRNKRTEMDKLKNVKIGYETIEQSGLKILEILPTEKDIPSVLIQLEVLANRNKLNMDSINISEPEKTGDINAVESKVQTMVLNLALSGGNYFDLKNYLIDIEKNLRLMDIRSIMYAPASKTYNLTIHTYYSAD